jgi:hypothetical protein
MREDPRVFIAKPLKGWFSKSSTGEVAAGLVDSGLWRPGECSRSWSAVLLPEDSWECMVFTEACPSVKPDEPRERLWLIPTKVFILSLDAGTARP